MAGEVPDFVPGDWVDAKRAKRLDRCSLFTLAAARMALTDADLELSREDPDRAGAMMGTALGGAPHAEADHERYIHGGIKAVDPGLALNVFAGASSTNLAIEFGITGPNVTNGMSCASGSIAIGEAYRAIREGDADIMLAGGAEAPLMPLTFGAFSIIRAMSTRNDDPGGASRPFDRARDGFVMAEGASVMVLEEYGRAVARGAPIYFEVAGYGLTNDAYHMTAPRPDGRQAARAMELALRDAHIRPVEVQYVNAHGSSTPLNDPTETSAIRQVFGDHADTLAVSGTKGYYGHALGASGAIEAAICALASRHCWLPPTVNLADADPACDLDYLAGEGRPADPEHLVSNSFGFGGINAVLVFRKT
jgi:3-oxoacyl-[acyl-carrier-protein] synthase II